MRFSRTNGGVVQLQPQALNQVLSFRQLTDDAPESGGMLLGRLVEKSEDVVVDYVSRPSPNDNRSRFSFFRSREDAQKIVNNAWAGSDGTSIYLGEWHTHPEHNPRPSISIDIPSWRTTTRTAHFEQDFLLFAIVGQVSIRMWEISKFSDALIQLRRFE